jgi:type IV pilus assembly protein PilB
MEDPLTILIAQGSLTEALAREIRNEIERKSITVEEALKQHGFSDEEILAAQQGGTIRVPTRSIRQDEKVPLEVLQYIPEESAKHYSVIALGLEEGILQVGMINPDDIEALDALNFITRKIGIPYKIFHITKADFERVLEMYRGLTGDVGTALDELATEVGTDQADMQDELNKVQTTPNKPDATIQEDAPIIKIVATILRYAVDGGASDIHIEPAESGVRVRFRLDGSLHTSLVLPRNTHQAVIARIKVLSAMRLDERRKPQDGRFGASINNRKIDFRVSTFPTPDGEKVVMRILDRSKGFVPLGDLGLSEKSKTLIKAALDRPYGLILVSGPTGSGKSTTLYSMLNELDRDTENVMSLEDPVEYRMEGVNQSQVRAEIGYSFASGLRTALRQDPDVIMVGEIRDGETAKLAVQAALTGHLVLSTIHTNDSTGVIPRLIDMGVDPYLIAPTLTLVVAQRLVRKLNPGTGKPIDVTPSMRAMMEETIKDLPPQFRPTFGNIVYEPEPTQGCATGMRGRVAVTEMFGMSSEIEKAILARKGDNEIYALARKQGMLTLREDAILKATSKVIPFSEVGTLGGVLLAEEVQLIQDSADEAEKVAAELATHVS